MPTSPKCAKATCAPASSVTIAKTASGVNAAETSRWACAGTTGPLDTKTPDCYTSAPLGLASTPMQVADTIEYFVCGAPAITGETLIIDGGVHLGGAPITRR